MTDHIAALEENLWSMWSQLGRLPGCSLHERDGALWTETPMPILPYNMVLKYQGAGDDDRLIDEIFSGYEAQGIPFLWFVHPSAGPRDLATRIEKKGFVEDERLSGMVADLVELPPPPEPPDDIELVDVTPECAFEPFLDFVANRWQIPESILATLHRIGRGLQFGVEGSPNRAFLAMKNETAVAKIVTHDSRFSVGVYGMITRTEERRRGLGRLVGLKALTEARKRGKTLAVLHSTPSAVPVYQSLGFREVAPFRVFAKSGSFHA